MTNTSTRLAGAGALAFGVLTFAGFFLANPPGSTYNASDVANYLANGHRVLAITGMYLGWLAILGLVGLLAHLRTVIDAGKSIAARIFWGTGLAAAASFAAGWCVTGGQVIAHLEGGKTMIVAPPVTQLIGELGVLLIFGSGSALLGLGLIALTLATRTAIPAWLRWLTLVAGLCGLAGPAFFTFFLLLLWAITFGLWLLAGGRDSAAALRAPTI
ncbi:MAG TPA: hypothetical protein VFM96_03415 [Gaiellaceae bacterium]|nr:hypothetical protein [Gaiellaceae bacterium]